MSQLQGSAFFATGVIEPSRFVSLDTTAGNLFSVVQSSGNDSRIIGISQAGTEDAPGVQGAQPDAARPGNLTPPGAPTLGSTAGGTLAAATYYVRITWVTAFGETTAGTEASFAVAANNVLTVTPPGSVPNGVLGYNVYVSTSSGTETKQNTALQGVTQVWTEPTSGLIVGAAMPSANTSGYPQAKASLLVYGPGDVCLLRIGAGGCSAGDWLQPDANGQGVPAALGSSSGQYYGAKALESAAAGELARVVVVLGAITGT